MGVLKHLGLCLLTAAASSGICAGINLFAGDGSAEAESDSLTQGVHSMGLLPVAVDDRVAFEGTRSIQVNWDGVNRLPLTNPNDLAGYLNRTVCVQSSLPLIAGKSYVYSFYARVEKPGMVISVTSAPDAAGWVNPRGAEGFRRIELTTDWKRYEVAFTANFTSGVLLKTYALRIDFTNCIPGKMWYDALQLEEGTSATPYRNISPVTAGAKLADSNTSGIFLLPFRVEGAIRVAAPEPSVGYSINAVLSDYRGNVVKTWSLPAQESGVHPFVLDGLAPGWYQIKTLVSCENRICFTHLLNFVLLTPPENSAAGGRPFMGSCGGLWKEMRLLGTKRAQIAFDWYGSRYGVENVRGKRVWTSVEARIIEAEKAGMKIKANLNVYSAPPWFFSGDEKTISTRVLAEQYHAEWLDFVRDFVTRYGSRIDEIEFGGEDNGRLGTSSFYKKLYPEGIERDAGGQQWLVRGSAFDDLMKLECSSCLLVKQLAPCIRTSVLRPSQGLPGDHWLFVRRSLERIGKCFTSFGVDTYGSIPYYYGPAISGSRQGTTDDRFHTRKLISEWLKELGHDQEVFISESGLGVDVRCADDSRYRIEQCEQLARDLVTSRCAGFYAFDWFGGINRFPQLEHSPYSFAMLHQGRIQSLAAAYSAAGLIVENVTETCWLTPDDITRIAVLGKVDGSGVAAAWGETGVSADFSGFAVTDLMGKPLKSGVMALSPAPLYLRHSDYGTLKKAMEKLPLQGSFPCEVSFSPGGRNTVLIEFRNRRKNQEFSSEARLIQNGQTEVRSLALPAGMALREQVQLTGADRNLQVLISGQTFAYTMPEMTEILQEKQSWSLLDEMSVRTRLLPADPWVPWSGPEDLSYQVYGAWDSMALHLKLLVKDDKHCPGLNPWNGDGIQIALDTLGNGVFSKGQDDDDLEIGLNLTPQGSRLVRSFGKTEVTEYQVYRDEARNMTEYVVSIPWSPLGVAPHAGQVVGLAFVAFDDDGGKGMEYYGFTGGGIAGKKDPKHYQKFLLR